MANVIAMFPLRLAQDGFPSVQEANSVTIQVGLYDTDLRERLVAGMKDFREISIMGDSSI